MLPNPEALLHPLGLATELKVGHVPRHGTHVKIGLQVVMHSSQLPGNSFVRSARSSEKRGEG